MRIHFGAAFCLALTLSASAIAQVAVQPGKWELTSTFEGLPFGGDGARTRTVCLSEQALGAFPEKALIDAAPQPGNDASGPAPPKCEYAQVHRDGAKSYWSVSCQNPKIAGLGDATILSPKQVAIQEKLELKIGFVSRSIQHDVRAHRVGDCS